MNRAVRHSGTRDHSVTPFLLAVVAIVCCPATLVAAPTITYVQGNYATPQTPQTSVSVTFTSPQTAGDLNVVVVGWNNSTTTVTAVTDTRGNAYALAVGPTVQTPVASQSIYYAKNIVAAGAGANAVTVTFSSAAAYPDIRILEYAGADLNNPVDAKAASSGSSATSNSGTVTTTNPNDLIFGANLVQTVTSGAGSGFTKRLLTSPDGDIAEDRMVTSTGSYSATASVSSGQWIMQMVAFRTPSGTAPTVTSVSPNSGPSAGGTPVTITGTNFATGDTVTFGAAAATGVVVVNSATITAVTPPGTGTVLVTVTNAGGLSGSLAAGFTYPAPPTVSSVSPGSGALGGGTLVTINGTNFLAGATVMFGSATATNVVVVNSTTITARTPAGSAGPVTVTVTNSTGLSGSLTNGFTYLAPPIVSTVSPNSGATTGGTAVTITGTNFAAGAAVTFGSGTAINVVVVNSTTITATTPAGSSGAVTVTITVNGQSGNLANGFTYVIAPTVSNVSPNNGPAAGGTTVTITGTNFAAGATVAFGGAAATNVVVANSTTITATTPAGTPGSVTVTVTLNGQSGSLTNGFTYSGGATITYIQGNYATPQMPQTTVSVTFTSAQAAGDLNVVVVGWNNSTATVTGVTDTRGNAYALAVGPTVQAPVATQSIYYAKNIVAAGAGANVVTVTFSSAAPYPDIRILEYSGADLSNPVDATAASSGNSATSSSGSATTTNPTDLIFGANLVQTGATGPGSGFTERLLTSPDADIAEDEMVNTIGSYNTTAPVSSGQWIMQMVAFRTPVSVGGGPTAPGNLIAAANRQGPINLSWTASSSSVGISNYIVQRCQGTGCTNFVQIATPAGTTYTDSSVSPSTTYSYRVEAVDAVGNLSAFSNIATTTTVGNQPPTAPSNLIVTPISTSQINLSWTASTSSIGLANYVVQRCQGPGCSSFAQIATPTGTTYTDTGLISNTSYSYQVEAIDIEGNISPFSNIATATTLSSSPTSITYVQGNFATPQSAQTNVSVTFTAAQAAGDLNVVVVGWNDSTATVRTVTDASGNSYVLAVGPTVESPVASQAIYYAKNIVGAAAGANSVSVTFSTAAAFPDIRILEYKGADPSNPVDVTAAAVGNSSTSSSGSVTTNAPTDLLFGADTVQTTTSGPGTGFTQRLLTSPDGDLAEDRMVNAVGSYSASAPVSSGLWIMQLVAFRTAGGCANAPPTVPTNLAATASSSAQITLSWTASSSCIGVAQYLVQRCQGSTCTNFVQVGTTTATTYKDAGLDANTTYSYRVQAMDNSGNSSAFSNTTSATTLAISISPRTAALTFTRTQQFTSAANVTWSVDGMVGGSTAVGTISSTGLYTPPSSVGAHTVTATTPDLFSASATVYVTNYPGTFTYHNDNLRTGQNLDETVLTLSNVNQNQFGKLFSYPLDGIPFASPLYVANVSIPGQGFHNVVYVATAHDSVYAFDADGLSTTPLWHTSFLGSGVTTVPCSDTGECGDIPTEIGIASTPVIDQSSGTIYVVAATKEGTNTWIQRLHALDITNGSEKFGGPVVLAASVSGTGSGASGGKVPFDPLRENQRPGLLLNNGVVYLGFGSHGDNSPWHGWVLGYNATTLQQIMAYNVTPNGNGGGIWQGGGGLATDATGNIYFVTSNGDFDANSGGKDYGDSVEKIGPTGLVVDYFTPFDQQNMNVNNLDLGAGGPVLLVDQTTGSFPHLLICAGKSGTIYVVNRDNMGKYNSSNDNQIVQSLPNALPNGSPEAGNFSTPVYFNGYIYFGAVEDNLRAFQLTNGRLSPGPTSVSTAIYGVRGASFAVSANGNSNGILWALQNNGTSANNDVGSPGVLFAYDANNLATVLYSSGQAGNRDTLDFAAKFSIPLVANGKVFVAGQSQLTAFGLLP